MQLLVIGQVVELRVQDLERLGCYDINPIEDKENVLTINTMS